DFATQQIELLPERDDLLEPSALSASQVAQRVGFLLLELLRGEKRVALRVERCLRSARVAGHGRHPSVEVPLLGRLDLGAGRFEVVPGPGQSALDVAPTEAR